MNGVHFLFLLRGSSGGDGSSYGGSGTSTIRVKLVL